VLRPTPAKISDQAAEGSEPRAHTVRRREASRRTASSRSVTRMAWIECPARSRSCELSALSARMLMHWRFPTFPTSAPTAGGFLWAIAIGIIAVPARYRDRAARPVPAASCRAADRADHSGHRPGRRGPGDCILPECGLAIALTDLGTCEKPDETGNLPKASQHRSRASDDDVG
jgi:hypothetical protein